MTAITTTEVAEEDRLDFLPRHLPNGYARFEMLAFSIMDRACDHYRGGFWEFFDLSNGGFFIAAARDEDRLSIAWEENFFAGEMSPEAAGIGVTLMALSWTSFDYRAAAEKFDLLRDFALDHPEAGAIFGFID